jgi:ATP-dependent DNA helicase RecG
LADSTSIEEFNGWLSGNESEHLEFKSARNQFSRDIDLPDYCAALANAGGGRLILGVNDDHKVVGTKAFNGTHHKLSMDLLDRIGIHVDVEELSHPEGRVLIFHIPSRPLGRLIKSTGKYTYPMRAGESLVEMDELTLRRILAEGELDFSSVIVSGFSISDIDETSVNNFRNRWAQKQQRDEYRNYTNEKTLRATGLLTDKGLTRAALLLFGKKEKIDSLLPGGEIIFEWRHDSGKTAHDFRKSWREPFFRIYDDIWESINARNNRFPYQDGLFQLEVYAYSEKPVREALLNAVAHRDYSITNQSIFIRLSPDSFSIESPGGFPRGVTVENVLVKSVWRNRLIAETFEKAGLVERSGQGIDDIFRKTITEGKGMPDFSGTDNYSVKLNIPGRIRDMNFLVFLEKIASEKRIALSFEEIYELEIIRENQKVISPEFRERFLHLGIIEKVGRTKDARYILSHNFYSHQGHVGFHTKLSGISREKYKELIIRHLEKNKGYLHDLEEALPELKPRDITNLLQELKNDEKIEHHGSKKTGFWILKN